MIRKTKIIATIGPKFCSPENIAQMIEHGANVFRINMSHAQHDWAREVTTNIRRQATSRGWHVGVLFDLTGPSIRTGDLEAPFHLKTGDLVEFRKLGTDPSIPFSTTVNYGDLMNDVAEGRKLVVDNGAILMEIKTKKDDRIICVNQTDNKLLGSRRHINLPGTRLNLPALTEKDHRDLKLAVECGADFIAGSFVRDAAHVRELRAEMEKLGGKAKLIAKLEDQEAIRNLDSIIKATDIIMVARGDLGVEVDFEELPLLQRRIVRRCHELSKRVIVATHMLESMITNPTPTRAEVTDVMNAAQEEADSIMLSGETATGDHPIECINAMHRIAKRCENSEQASLGFGKLVELSEERQKTMRAAVSLVDSLDSAHLIVITRRGTLATQAAMFRPKTQGFYAFTPTIEVCRQLTLCRGLRSFSMDFSNLTMEQTIEKIATHLRDLDLIKPGMPMVIVSDLLSDQLAANSILLHHA